MILQGGSEANLGDFGRQLRGGALRLIALKISHNLSKQGDD